MCGIVGLVGWWRSLHLLEILLIATSLAVSAVPEGLPAVVTVCFALGVRRMAKQSALVRRLDALETLGAVTVVCSDKTGTITSNRMTVVDHRAVDGMDAPTLAGIFASCSHGELPDAGDPTELALLAWSDAVGGTREPIDVEEVPFTSEAKYMRTRHAGTSYLKGSPEKILSLCDDPPAGVMDDVRAFGERGLRVLGAAVSDADGTRFVGLAGMTDPPREGVKEAVAEASHAGIRTVMITGDDPVTARAIASQVGIEGRVRTGKDIDALDAEQLKADIAETAIYARVSPQHKVELCEALLARGEIVAMSGDGVNDAPALKRAHVGVAMGLRGTDVAREAAAIVLADDHFATIIQAVREGRRIHDNIRRFVLFLLRANFDELLVILVAVAFALPLPLLPIHILWINLVTDGLPALALAAEPAHEGVMARPPRDSRAHLLAGAWGQLVAAALVGFVTVLGFFLWRLSAGDSLEHVRAATVTLTICIELVQAVSARSERPLWVIGLRGNPWLSRAIAFVFGIHLLVLYTPLAHAFGVVPLAALDWLEIAVVTAVVGVVLEGMKVVLPSRRA
jgi:Ca2+-transporting ATPase